MIVEEEKGREKEVLEEKDRLGVFCPRKQRFVFKESVLEKGEEFYEAEVKSKVDRFKGRVFVRLKNTEGGDEVWKCVLCMEVFSKTEGKKKGGKGLEGKKEEEEEEEKKSGEREGAKKKRKPAFKLSFFYKHLVKTHEEYVRSLKVEEVPKDGDCVTALRSFFLDKKIHIDEEVMSVLE